MKKIIALILALILCFTVAGCTITQKEASDKETAVSSANGSKSTEAAETSAKTGTTAVAEKGDKLYASIEEYISDPEISKSLDSTKEKFGDKLTFEYHAEGDKLIYDYTYTEQYSEAALVSIKPTLEASFEEEADSFNQVVDVLKKTVNTESPKLVINYRNGDGSIIATHTFE